ncbi:ABC transporter ATP-binding protein [Synechococcus elongatus]|uniref:ABC transporter ATP-binding protein n=1 Tax=Synechococcus elongatus PCC 11802 TaxID=2283154 RepID=A0AAT9JXH7_SYNEL|nr:ABC transporter ATP-binding protein [Synechococcus elongatus]QFZ93103.1 ABC transporter ATP-binding protein [Synechococcus elongatus PCC 11802]
MLALLRRWDDWSLLQRLLPYLGRYQRPLIGALILLVPLALAGAVQPMLVGQAISVLQNKPTWTVLQGMSRSDGLNLLSLALLVTIVVRLAFRGVQGYYVQEVGQRVTADIRQDLFQHVTSLAVRFFDRTPVGKLVTRLTNDVEALGEVFSTGAIGILSDIVSLLAIAIAMFWLQWQLALLLTVLLLPTTAVILYFQRRYRIANYRAREELSNLNATLQENMVGIGIVQSFRREAYNAQQFRVANQHYLEAVDRTIFHDSAISATLEWISLAAIAAVLWLGSFLVLQDQMNFGLLAAFILYSQRLFDPLRQLAEKFTSIQAGFTAIERIVDIFNEPIEIRDAAKPQQLSLDTSQSGEIRFENVWFGYKPDEPVIHNLNITIQPGQKVALVGPTGAGKSTIIRLLCRLYEPTQGRILIDGIDIRDLPQVELRRHLGVILQDGFLFAGDVQSNITLGEPYDTDAVQTAARRTNVADLIESLPQAYATPLRERGTNLSGGQRQLLAFARVAIRDPKVLILDEATANLDVGTEALVQEALDDLLSDRTAIIIAHRLSTIRNADRILVLRHGQLIEDGSHDVLMARNGLYTSLYRLQSLGVEVA